MSAVDHAALRALAVGVLKSGPLDSWEAVDAYRNAADPQAVLALLDEVQRLREALQDILNAVCGDTGFAAAVREHSGTAYPWEPLDIAEEKARIALGDRHD